MRARKLIAAAATAAALAGGVALSAPANATSYYDTDGTYGGGYMGDYDGSAYANMFSVVGSRTRHRTPRTSVRRCAKR